MSSLKLTRSVMKLTVSDSGQCKEQLLMDADALEAELKVAKAERKAAKVRH